MGIGSFYPYFASQQYIWTEPSDGHNCKILSNDIIERYIMHSFMHGQVGPVTQFNPVSETHFSFSQQTTWNFASSQQQ